MELCKSRLRLRPIESFLRQGFPFPACMSSGGSNSSLSPLAVSLQTRFAAARMAHRFPEGLSEVSCSDYQVEVTDLFATQEV